MSAAEPSNGNRLDSWKEIAAHLNRDVRTAMRWEKERGLPVHRAPGKRSGVYALPREVDVWLNAEAARQSNGHGLIAVPAPASRIHPKRLTAWVAASAVSSLAIVTVLLTLSAPGPEPRLGKPTPITNDGLLKENFLVTPQFLYYVSGEGDARALRRIPIAGGPAVAIYAAPWLSLASVFPDGSEFLVSRSDAQNQPWPRGILTAGGTFRYLGVEYTGAEWSPDGKTMVHAREGVLYQADHDGSGARKVAKLPARSAGGMSWSPDGKRLRFLVATREHDDPSERLWEVNLEQPEPRPVLPGWSRGVGDYESAGHGLRTGSTSSSRQFTGGSQGCGRSAKGAHGSD